MNAPAVFRYTAPTNPQRHLFAARLMGADVSDAGPEDAGDILADAIVDLLKNIGVPNGLEAIGYTPDDAPALAAGAMPQRRVIDLSPRQVEESDHPPALPRLYDLVVDAGAGRRWQLPAASYRMDFAGRPVLLKENQPWRPRYLPKEAMRRRVPRLLRRVPLRRVPMLRRRPHLREPISVLRHFRHHRGPEVDVRGQARCGRCGQPVRVLPRGRLQAAGWLLTSW